MDLIYDDCKRALCTGKLDLGADDIYVMLAPDSYKPEAGHKRADVPEIEGEGYAAGGKPIANRRFSKAGQLSTDPIVWPESTIKARWAVLYKKPGTLLAAYDLGKGKASSNGEFKVEFPEGILSVE